MGEKITCFWLRPTGRVHRGLRRYATGKCKKGRHGIYYHNAYVALDVLEDGNPRGFVDIHLREEIARDHPEWPTACDRCGYTFAEEDHWQVAGNRIYTRLDTGKELLLRDAPPGSMWDAWWMRTLGPDGRSLTLKTPGGEWWIDGKSKNGDGWKREGKPPKITARPSIGIYNSDGKTWRYHGWLTDGVLEAC